MELSSGPCVITLFDGAGRELKRCASEGVGEKLQIGSPGIYILKVSANGVDHYRKVVVTE